MQIILADDIIHRYRNAIIIKFWIFTTVHIVKILLGDWSTLESCESVNSGRHWKVPVPVCVARHGVCAHGAKCFRMQAETTVH